VPEEMQEPEHPIQTPKRILDEEQWAKLIESVKGGKNYDWAIENVEMTPDQRAELESANSNNIIL
jgi:hypothetical protein